MDREPWWATVHGVTKNQTQLTDFTYQVIIILTLQMREQAQGNFQLTPLGNSRTWMQT